MADSVLDLLREINDAGTTIIMVTHELELADRARRNIFVRDGELYDVDTPAGSMFGAEAPPTEAEAPPTAASA